MLPWVGCRGKALTRLDVRPEERSCRVEWEGRGRREDFWSWLQAGFDGEKAGEGVGVV